MKLVKQRNLGECGAACLAMVLDKDLDEVLADFLYRPESGITPTRMIEYLAKRGVPALESLTLPSNTVKAILTVASLNHPGLLHYVVWDGEKFLDPGGPLNYMDNAPIVNDRPQVYWSSAILLWL